MDCQTGGGRIERKNESSEVGKQGPKACPLEIGHFPRLRRPAVAVRLCLIISVRLCLTRTSWKLVLHRNPTANPTEEYRIDLITLRELMGLR